MLNIVNTQIRIMKAVRQTQFGKANVLNVENNIPIPKSTENTTLVKVTASALNRADTLMRMGRYPHQGQNIINLGLEISGHEVESGRPVMALLKEGGYAEYTIVPNSQIMTIPKNVDLKTAAAIPEVWLTAWQLLSFVANVPMKGEVFGFNPKTVLIHGGASGVGTAASQLSKNLLNLKVITTVGSDEKVAASLKYGADFSINYKTTNWKTQVNEITNGKGVDVILDCIGGSYFSDNLDSLASDGRWVQYGFLGGVKIDEKCLTTFLPKLLGKRGQLLASTLNARPESYKKELIKDFSAKVLPRFETGELVPVVDKVFNVENVVSAHEYMESNKNIGKILLEF